MTPPADPALVLRGLCPRLYAELARLVAELHAHGTAALPDVGAEARLLARATWRWWLAGRPWAPLSWGRALEGWPEALVVGPAAGEGPRLTVDAQRAWTLSPLEIEVLGRLDEGHVVATDPSLARVRDALLQQAVAGDLVYVEGPLGSGRGALAAWAVEVALLLDASSRAERAEPGGPPPTLPPRPTGAVIRDVEERPVEDRARVAAFIVERFAAGTPTPSRRGVRPTDPALRPILGHDEALCRVLREAERHGRGTHPVLILGETGTGKEGMAQALHLLSGRRGKLVRLDLASRPENLREDDLFGHVPGAFDGARTARAGAVREADGGTLLLDEIGNLPLSAQARLLRLLDNHEVQPLGSDAAVRVDVRILAATNADLHAMAKAGTFRPDLLYRIATAEIRLPPLRERRGDILLLARHYARDRALSDEARERLVEWRWPGNVRELKGVMENACALTTGEIGVEHLGEVGLRPPLIVTGQSSPERIGPPLTRRQAQELAGVRVQVAAPAERGRGCLLNAVLHGLDGHPITPEALDALLAAPWWGNFLELRGRLKALLRASSGPIELAAVRELLRGAGGGDRVPIVTLFGPSLRGDGGVGGLTDESHAGALIIGRVDSLRELAGDPSDARSMRRRALLEATLGGAVPAFLPFRHLTMLSRGHLLVTREGDTLLATLLPEVGLPTFAGRLGERLSLLDPGRPVALGEAGELRVEHDGEPLLELFVFLGPEARQAAEPRLAARLGGDARVTMREERGARRVAALDPRERALLTDIVAEIVALGAEFSPHLRRRLGEAEGPAAEHLRQALLGGKPSQAATRLYQFEPNRQACVELRDELMRRGLLDRARDVLPRGIWDALTA